MQSRTYPLYGFLKGDTIGLLILAHDEEKVSTLAEKLVRAAHVRVAPCHDVDVFYHGRRLDPNGFIMDVGFDAMDRFDVIPAEASCHS